MTRVALLKSRLSFRGGLEKYTLCLAQEFAAQGVEVTLLTTGKPFFLPRITVLSLAPDSKWTWRHVCRFDRLCQSYLRSHPHPLVFGMERTTEQTHYRAGSGVHATFLEQRAWMEPWYKRLSFKINPLHRTLLAMEARAFCSPSLRHLFTNSDMVRTDILSRFGVAPAKVTTIHNGVDWWAKEEPFTQTFLQPREPNYQFLFIGNGYTRKGLKFLLNGLHALPHREWHTTIVGKDSREKEFISYADQLGLSPYVTFAGPQKDLLSFYQKADALVIPSLYDPFANVTVEALAMGIPVLSSLYNGGKEVLQPQTGLLIEDLANPSHMAERLQQMIQSPKTYEKACYIRNSIKHLDFSNQLAKIVQQTLTT